MEPKEMDSTEKRYFEAKEEVLKWMGSRKYSVLYLEIRDQVWSIQAVAVSGLPSADLSTYLNIYLKGGKDRLVPYSRFRTEPMLWELDVARSYDYNRS